MRIAEGVAHKLGRYKETLDIETATKLISEALKDKDDEIERSCIPALPNGWYLDRMFQFPLGVFASFQTYTSRISDVPELIQVQDMPSLREAFVEAIERIRALKGRGK